MACQHVRDIYCNTIDGWREGGIRQEGGREGGTPGFYLFAKLRLYRKRKHNRERRHVECAMGLWFSALGSLGGWFSAP